MRKFGAMLRTGEISQETFDKWARETNMSHLPARVKGKPRKKRRIRAR